MEYQPNKSALHYPFFYEILGWFGIAMGVGFAAMSAPLASNIRDQIFLISGGAFFALLGIYLVLARRRARVLFDESGIQEIGILSAKPLIRWSEITDIKFLASSLSIDLVAGLKKARIKIQSEGFPEFVAVLRKKCKPEMCEPALQAARQANALAFSAIAFSGAPIEIHNDENHISRYFYSRIRIGLMLLAGGFALSCVSLFLSDWFGESTHTIYWGLSLYGLIFLGQMLYWRRGIAANGGTTIEPIPTVTGLRKITEIALVVLTFVGALSYFSIQYVIPRLAAASHTLAAATPSASIPGWYDAGSESGIVIFSMPGQPNYDWTFYRASKVPIPTRAIEYSLMTPGNDAYNFSVEWLYDDAGTRLYSPTIESEMQIVRDWFNHPGAVLQQSDYKMPGNIMATRYTISYGQLKIAGILFERKGKYYDLSVWPNNPDTADSDLDQMLSSVRFKD